MKAVQVGTYQVPIYPPITQISADSFSMFQECMSKSAGICGICGKMNVAAHWFHPAFTQLKGEHHAH
jgi:hypothetical protein